MHVENLDIHLKLRQTDELETCYGGVCHGVEFQLVDRTPEDGGWEIFFDQDVDEPTEICDEMQEALGWIENEGRARLVTVNETD